MGVDSKIYLKNHASVEKVYDVMAVILGAEKTFKGEDDVDFKEESSPTNTWRIKVNHSNGDQLEYKAPTYFDIRVNDNCGNTFSSLFFYDLDDDKYAQNGEKALNPRASATWIAIGKKLVEFFGGKLMYADCEDGNDPKNWLINEKGLYSPEINHCDDRWYNYHNALSKIKPLTAEDILENKDVCAYWGEREEILITKLPRIEQFNELTKELKNENKSSTRKMKV